MLEESQSSAPDTKKPAHPEIPLEFNPLQQDFRQNPYPIYRQFREAGPSTGVQCSGFGCARVMAILSPYYAIPKPAPTQMIGNSLMIKLKP